MINIEILAIETKAIAAARAIVAPSDKEGLIILEIGTVNSRVSIIDNRQVRFVSTINIGGDQIIQQITGKLDDQKAFLKAKYEVGIKNNADEAKLVIEKIADDLTKAIRYHQARDYKAARIAEIRLCGSGSLIPGLPQAIEEQIKIKTVLAKYSQLKIPKELDQRYAVALGLGLFKE